MNRRRVIFSALISLALTSSPADFAIGDKVSYRGQRGVIIGSGKERGYWIVQLGGNHPSTRTIHESQLDPVEHG